ncbi:hypothetical protein HYH02_003766 [Chlamydomonas schloesseri]|uniref:Uncharacterized protein n=1 Tax=Chlamydomonas schloesseri TaxID=2026947 RepID=A0A835WPW3_9CHLO|nr:hypothetical protein HYH02_003766 [Chlamydomonas schloesseri]|eukprot:KAG2451158.1 hypothetical protein HYH02_003766 [Chlamydomonas schloesseri]
METPTANDGGDLEFDPSSPSAKYFNYDDGMEETDLKMFGYSTAEARGSPEAKPALMAGCPGERCQPSRSSVISAACPVESRSAVASSPARRVSSGTLQNTCLATSLARSLSSDPAAPSSPENPNTAAGVASFSRGIPATNASTCNPVSTGYTSKSFGNGSAGPRKSAMMLPGFITTPPALPPPAPEEQVALLRQQPLPMLREILHQLRSGLGRTTAASAAPAASSAALAATTAACRAAAAAGHTQTAVDEGAWQIFEAVFKGTWQQLEMQKQQHKACVRGQAGASAGPGNGGQQPATAPNAASGADATVGRGATTTKPATGIQDKRQQVPRARPAAKGTAAARAQQPLARTQAVKVGSKRAAGMVESAAGPTARQMDDLERPTKRRVVEARAPAAVPAPASARVVMAEPQQPQQHCQQPGQLHRGNVATGHHHQVPSYPGIAFATSATAVPQPPVQQTVYISQQQQQQQQQQSLPLVRLSHIQYHSQGCTCADCCVCYGVPGAPSQGTQVLAQAPSWPQAQQAQWQWGPTGFMCVQRHGQAYPAVHYSGAYAYAYT